MGRCLSMRWLWRRGRLLRLREESLAIVALGRGWRRWGLAIVVWRLGGSCGGRLFEGSDFFGGGDFDEGH